MRRRTRALALAWEGSGRALIRMLAIRRRPLRRLIAFTAILALCALSFASGVHSVHHLADSQGGAACSALPASGLVAVDVERWDLSASPLVVLGVIPVGSESIPPVQCFRRDQGRAPPASPSA